MTSKLGIDFIYLLVDCLNIEMSAYKDGESHDSFSFSKDRNFTKLKYKIK